MKRTKVILYVALAVVLCFSFTACTAQSPASSASPSAAQSTAAASSAAPAATDVSPAGVQTGDVKVVDGKKFNIGVAMAGLNVPFCSAMVQGFNEAAAKYGVTLDIQDGQWDTNTQISTIQNMITQKKDAIIVMENTPGTLGQVLKEASDAKIPLVGVNRKLDYEGVTVASNVLGDNTQYGYQIAASCSKMLGGDTVSASICMITGPVTDSIVQSRLDGINQYMKEKNVAWKIIDQQDGKWQKADDIVIMQSWITRYPKGEFDGVISMDPYGAVAFNDVITAASRTELAGKVVCGDLPKEVIDGIKNGTIYGTVRQDPMEQAYLSTQAVYAALTNQKVDAWWKTPLPIVTKDNLDQYPATW